jgi:hypothetical protein
MSKQFVYLVDDLDSIRIAKIQKTLAAIPEIENVSFSKSSGTISAMAEKDVEEHVRAAVKSSGATFKIKV